MSLDNILLGNMVAVGLSDLLLDTLAPALALACARTLGSEASLSVHYCVWAWGDATISHIVLKIFKCARRERG